MCPGLPSQGSPRRPPGVLGLVLPLLPFLCLHAGVDSGTVCSVWALPLTCTLPYSCLINSLWADMDKARGVERPRDWCICCFCFRGDIPLQSNPLRKKFIQQCINVWMVLYELYSVEINSHRGIFVLLYCRFTVLFSWKNRIKIWEGMAESSIKIHLIKRREQTEFTVNQQSSRIPWWYEFWAQVLGDGSHPKNGASVV